MCVRILRWGEEWVRVGSKSNRKGPYKREAGRGNLSTGEDSHVAAEARCYTAGFEDGGRRQEPRAVWDAALEAGKGQARGPVLP